MNAKLLLPLICAALVGSLQAEHNKKPMANKNMEMEHGQMAGKKHHNLHSSKGEQPKKSTKKKKAMKKGDMKNKEEMNKDMAMKRNTMNHNGRMMNNSKY